MYPSRSIVAVSLAAVSMLAGCTTVETKTSGTAGALQPSSTTEPAGVADIPGWRRPNRGDYTPDILAHLGRIPQNRAAGDFDGDGMKDLAAILINDAENRYAAFVMLSSRAGANREIMVESQEMGPAKVYLTMRALPAGEIPTFCGRMGDCAAGEPASVHLRANGLMVGYLESSAKLYYWNPADKDFDSVFISD